MPYAENHGVKIFYEVEGGGYPLILQHGFAATHWTWRDFGYAAALSKRYRLILTDARAHGESDKPHNPGAYRPEVMAADYAAVLDAMRVEKCVYIGYSMGAELALACLSRYLPERFSAFILGGIDPMRERKPGESLPATPFVRMLEEASEKGMDVWLAFRERALGRLSPEQRTRQLRNDPAALLAMLRALYGWPAAGLSEITLPCLLFAGERDPAFEGARAAAKLMPKADFAPLPGLDHDSALMQSRFILPEIEKFLAAFKKK